MSPAPSALKARTGGNLVVLLGCVLLFALHLSLAAPMRAPIIYADEAANLGIARFLAGAPPYPHLAPPFLTSWVAYYHFGYPLLVAPAWLFTREPLSVYRLALVLNGLLISTLFPLLFAWARRTLALADRHALLIAFAASLYTSFLLQPNLTWSESMLIPAVAGLLLGFQRVVARPGTIAACAVALLATSVYAVHERTLGLVPLTLLALVLLWRGNRLTGRATVAAFAAALAVLAAIRLLDREIFARLWGNTAPRYGPGDIAANLLDPGSLAGAGLSLTGQLWTLTVASALLFPLGVWVLAWTAWRAELPEQRLSARFTLGVAAVLLATSSVFITRFPRADLAVYGRYSEAFLAPFLVAGCAGFAGVLRRHRVATFALALLPGLLAAILLAGHDDAVFRQVYNEMTISGILPAVLLVGGLRILRIAALGTVAGVAILVAGLLRPWLAAALAGALFLTGAVWVHQSWLVPVQQAGFEARSLPIAVRALGIREVAYDIAKARADDFFAYQLRLGDSRFVFFDDRTALAPRELVVSGKSFGQRHSEARLLFPEKAIDQALWVMPGPLQDRLLRDGWLFPADPGAPLPQEAECALLTPLRPMKALALRPGGERRLSLRLTHCGAAAPWLPFGARENPLGTVRVGVVWLRDGVVVADQRGELPHVVAPGTAVEIDLPLAAHTTAGLPLPVGSYEVKIGMVQELVRWFAETAEGTLRLAVTVE